jgi:hypothetical protein
VIRPGDGRSLGNGQATDVDAVFDEDNIVTHCWDMVIPLSRGRVAPADPWDRQARRRYTSWTFPALGPLSPLSGS